MEPSILVNFPIASKSYKLMSYTAELKRHIVELSSDSPNSLAALARTHTANQREAEKALYDTLFICASDDSLKPWPQIQRKLL